MTDEQRTRTIAGVMGWEMKYVYEKNKDPRDRYWCRGCAPMVKVSEYNPLTDPNQAFEALDKWRNQDADNRRWHIGSIANGVEVVLEELLGHRSVDVAIMGNKSLAVAICDALIKATKEIE